MGIEKVEPQIPRKDVTRTLLVYAQQHIRNTGQRFRFHSLQQKWNIYTTYWNRTMREIENGTYRRDVARLGRRLEREGEDLPEEARFELKLKRRRPGALAKETKEEAAAPAPPPAANTQTAAAKAPPPPAPAAVPPRAKRPTPAQT